MTGRWMFAWAWMVAAVLTGCGMLDRGPVPVPPSVVAALEEPADRSQQADPAGLAIGALTEPPTPAQAAAAAALERALPLGPGWHSPPPCGPIPSLWAWCDQHVAGGRETCKANTRVGCHLTPGQVAEVARHSPTLAPWVCGSGFDIRYVAVPELTLCSIVRSAQGSADCPADPRSVYPLPAQCGLAKVACADGFWKRCGVTCAEVHRLCSPVVEPTCGDAACNGTETCASCPQDCGKCPDPDPDPTDPTEPAGCSELRRAVEAVCGAPAGFPGGAALVELEDIPTDLCDGVCRWDDRGGPCESDCSCTAALSAAREAQEAAREACWVVEATQP